MSVGLSNLETDGGSWLSVKTPSAGLSSPSPAPRTVEVRGSAERERSASSVGSNSIKTLLKDSTSFTKRLEAVEQQMLAMHMRAAAATEAAENIAHNTVAPFSDEISALKARMEMTEQQLSNCAPAGQMERLADRLQEAEGSSLSTEHAVVLARLEESMSILSRQLHDTTVKVEDLEQGRTDPERIERISRAVESIGEMVQQQQARQTTEADANNSRFEAVEQQLSLVQRSLVDIQTPQHAAVANLSDRISAMESSYQEMGSAILRHQDAIRPLIENEISGLVIRLDAQEKMIQSNAAQAICRNQIAEENEMEKKSYQEDLLNRITEFEQKLQAFAAGSQQTSTLSARVSVLEKQVAAAPSAGEFKKLQAELQSTVAAAEFQFQKAAENAVDEVRKQTARFNDEASRVKEGLAGERQERFLALSDVDRLSEVVAKAAASTLERAEKRSAEERAEKRSAEEFYLEREKLRQEQGMTGTLSFVSTPSLKDTATGQDAASITVSSVGPLQDRPTPGSDLALFIGDMDGELRMELTGCLEEVHQDIDALRQGLTLRIASVEQRLEAMEEHSGAKLKDMAEELSMYKQLQLDPKKAAEGPRIKLRPHSRKLTQADSLSSGPGSSGGPSSEPGSSAGRYIKHATPVQSTLEALSPQGGAVNPAQTEVAQMFRQAVKQIAPEASQPGPSDEKRSSLSPVRQQEISDDLKANLRNLVSAVNHALGDAEVAVPERTASVPFRSDMRTGVRSTSPQQRHTSMPPTMVDSLGTSASGYPTQGPNPGVPSVMPTVAGALPLNRGRSPEGNTGGTPLQASRGPIGSPPRSASFAKMGQPPGSGNVSAVSGGGASAGSSISAAALAGAANRTPSGQVSQGGSVTAKIGAAGAAQMTRPGMGRPLQQERIVQGLQARPSAGQPAMPKASTGQSPRSNSVSMMPQRRR